MRDDEVKAIFDQMAPNYDRQWAKMAPIPGALHYLLESVFAPLPADARILCVGVGTGAELAHLAKKFPGWSFTAVEPSGPMLAECRRLAEREGIASRCHFHEGYLQTLPDVVPHDAATCFLVSQFILDQQARTGFFRSIAERLKPGGILASSDLASGANAEDYDPLLAVWLKLMSGADMTPEALERMKAAYSKDVAVLPPANIASIIQAGGFEAPVRFFQAGLIHAWFCRRRQA